MTTVRDRIAEPNVHDEFTDEPAPTPGPVPARNAEIGPLTLEGMSETREDLTHEGVLLRVANAMMRAAVVPMLATVGLGVLVFGVLYGPRGALGALVGGLVVSILSIATLLLMRRTAALDVNRMMAAAFGGFMVKMALLFVVLSVVRHFDVFHLRSVAITMVATIVVAAAVEARAATKTRMPYVIPDTGQGQA